MENKTILITGSSSGIGKAIAKFFSEKGWNVVATMRNPQKEQELTNSDKMLVNRLDVTDNESIKSSIKEAIEKFGKIDVVVNNAGYGAFGPLEAFDMEGIKKQFNVNVFGLLDVIKEVLPHFRSRKEGMIINISSIGGKMAMPLGTLYHGTKFAVEGMSEALTYEFEKIGAKIKVVEPGAIKTDFAGRSFDFRNTQNIPEYQEMTQKLMGAFEPLLKNAPGPRVVAEVVYEAATDGSNKLRYTAGEDAKQFMQSRKQLGDEEFQQNVKNMFGL